MIPTRLEQTEINGQTVWKTMANLADLHVDPSNPKEISDDKHTDLCDYLEEYGQFQPLLVDARPEKLGFLLGGNSTCECLKEIGKTEAWVEFRTPTDDADALKISTIANAQFGVYIQGKLTQQIRAVEDKIQADIKRLTVSMGEVSFHDLVHPAPPPEKKQKFEIILRCTDQVAYEDTLKKVAQLGVPYKTKK